MGRLRGGRREARRFAGWLAAFIAFVISVAAIVSAARAAEPIASASYTHDYDGLINVGVMVNGAGPYDFVIDTASTITLAFNRLAVEQAFTLTDEPPRRVLGLSGAQMLPTYFMGDINVAGLEMPDHVGVLIGDYAPPRRTPHGILGLDFLRRYAFAFDARSKIMTVYPPGGVPEEVMEEMKKIRIRPKNYNVVDGELFTVRGRINDKLITFIVDLGSAATMMNYEASVSLFVGRVGRTPTAGFTTGSHVKDIFDDRTRIRTARVNRLQLDRTLSWRDLPLYIYDAPIFDEIDVQRYPYGLMGVDMLAGRSFVLDFSMNEMHIEKTGRSRR